jgi:hypothetical protein
MEANSKLLFLNFIFLVLTVFFALTFNPFLRSGSLDFFTSSQGVPSLLVFLVGFVVWSVAISLVAYLSPSFKNLAVSFLPSALFFGAGLFGTGGLLVKILLSAVLLLSTLVFALKVRREGADRIKFSVLRIFSPALRSLATLVIVLFSLAFFFPYREQIQTEGFRAPEVLIDRVVDVVGRTLVETTVNQIAASSKLPNKEAVFTEIPEEIGDAGLTATLEEEFGVRIDRVPQSSADLLGMIKPSLEAQIKSEIESYLAPIAPWLPAIISLLIFLSLLPLAAAASYLIVPLLALAFFLLKAIGFTRIETKTTQTTRPILES